MDTQHELVFSLSYPVQVAVMGMMLAATFILVLHLCFTAGYHFPLNKLNFALQLVSTLCLLASQAATLGVQLRELHLFSQHWPHMFPYIAYRLPRTESWSTVKTVMFILLEATYSITVHATYIEFLMLLYPSKLERGLILWFLGPFALVQAGMYFADLAPSDDDKTQDLFDAIMNICDSSLALMYLSGLFIWGGLLNWRRAWRTDGSTAAFGIATLSVATCKTVVSFVHIGYDRAYWFRMLSATFSNWQCWLGFWWWVSAGMGIGEYEDRLRAREKKAPARRRWRSRRLSRENTQDASHTEGESLPPPSNADSAPWPVRMSRRLAQHTPRVVRRRIEYLSRVHSRAVSDAAMQQAAAYVKVFAPGTFDLTTRSELLRKFLLKDRTVYE